MAEYLRQMLLEQGMEGAEIVTFFAGDEEGDAEYTAVVKAIEAVADKGSVVSVKQGEAGHVVPGSSALDITRPHLRAVTKIAFHYILAHSDVLTGHEATFEAAKRFIVADEDFEGRIALIPEPIVAQLRQGYSLRQYGHFLQADVTYREIVVRAQFFVGPAVSPPTWVVRFGANPSAVYTGSFGHGFILFNEPADDGHQGEVTELTTIRRGLMP
jgi:hypothetical protein